MNIKITQFVKPTDGGAPQKTEISLPKENHLAYLSARKRSFEEQQYFELLVQEKIQVINDTFDATIDEHLSKYPKREQDTFAEKKRQAEVVLGGGESIYIDGRAKELGITSKQFAQILLQKNNEWTAKYLELEIAKDAQIAELKTLIK